MSIDAIRPPDLRDILPVAEKPSTTHAGGDFRSLLSDSINRVDQFQKTAQEGIDRFLSGENDEVHQVALATQRSELAFDMFLQVRNKVVQAYQEVMRMQM